MKKIPITETFCGKCPRLYDGSCPRHNNPKIEDIYPEFGETCPFRQKRKEAEL